MLVVSLFFQCQQPLYSDKKELLSVSKQFFFVFKVVSDLVLHTYILRLYLSLGKIVSFLSFYRYKERESKRERVCDSDR